MGCVGVGTAVGLGGLPTGVSVAVAAPPGVTVAIGEVVEPCARPGPDAVAVGVWCAAEKATSAPLTPPTSRAPQMTKAILLLIAEFTSPCVVLLSYPR